MKTSRRLPCRVSSLASLGLASFGVFIGWSGSITVSSAAVPKAPEQTAPVVANRAHDGSPRLVVGALSAAWPGHNPETVAERYLLELRRTSPAWVPNELSSPEVLPVGTGHVVRFSQKHHGLPVFGSELNLRISEGGQVVRLARSVVSNDELARISPLPSLSGQDAQRALATHGPGAVGEAQLGVDLATHRLVYRVSRTDLSRLEQADYLIDAFSGEIVRRIDLLKFLNQFSVYRYNPATTSNTEVVGIPAADASLLAPAGSGSRVMTSTLLRSANCIDDFKLRVPGTGGNPTHLCSLSQSMSNGQGDYSGFPPLVGAADGRCPTVNDSNRNGFGEAHMYWHTASAYSIFRSLFSGLGTNDFKLAISTGGSPQPFPLVTNLCMPDAATAGNPNAALKPFENAFFSPGSPGGGFSLYLMGVPGDMVAFGMGAKANYSMDADVIYHEFVHAVVSARKRLVESVGLDGYGLNDDPGAMNEGLADYFSSGITGDGVVGEYAKQNFGLATAGLRDLDNSLHCSNNRVGEVHEDANAWSGALWRARKAVTGDPKDASPVVVQKRKAFDQAVLAALEGSVPTPVMSEMGTLVVDEVGKLASTLGADAKQKTQDAMTTHGILDKCDRVIKVQTPHKLLCLDSDGKKLWPGHAQWRIDLPMTADTVQFDFKTLSAGAVCNPIDPKANSLEPKLQLAVSSGGSPITWDQSFNGTYEKLVAVQQGADSSTWTVKLTLERGKTHHLMLVNSGGPRIAKDIVIATSCAAADGCPAPAPVPMGSDSGCGCTVGGASPARSVASVFAALSLLVGVVLRRRRSA